MTAATFHYAIDPRTVFHRPCDGITSRGRRCGRPKCRAHRKQTRRRVPTVFEQAIGRAWREQSEFADRQMAEWIASAERAGFTYHVHDEWTKVVSEADAEISRALMGAHEGRNT